MEKKDGALVIETKLSTEKFETDLKKIDKSTKNMINRYNKSVDSIKNQELAIEKVKNKIEELQLYADTGFIKDSELGQLEHLNKKLDILNSKLEESKKQTNELGKEINKNLGNKAKFAGIIDGFDGVGKKIDKLKTRMTRLIGTVAIFNLIRNSLTNLRNGYISLLKQNDSFSSSLNQIKANLMTAFAPIYNACLPAINSLMNALSKVTGTLAVFVSGLFGTSLKDAKKQAEGLSKSLDDTAKSGEKASGSLASFDNLEVIADNNSSVSSSNNGIDYSGEITYSQKLLDILNNIKNFVVDNKELIIGFIAGITGALVSLKLLGLDPIMGLGIGLVVAGIVLLIQDIIDFINDPSWEKFGEILIDIGIILGGLALIIGGIPLAIAAACAVIIGLIIKYWDEICAFFEPAVTWIYEKVIKPIGDFFSNLCNSIKDGFTNAGNWVKEKWNAMVEGGKNAWASIKNVFSTVATFFKNIFTDAWEGVKKVFSTGGKIFVGIKDGILNGFKAIVNAIITGINKVVSIPFNGINWALQKIRDIEFLGISPFKNLIKTINVPQIPKLATGAVIPPRSEFMAILGDQKRGVNIETPLDTMVEAFNKALDDRNAGNGELVIENLTIVNRIGNTDISKTVVKGVRIAEKQLGKPLFVN
jgi:phage-related protein